MVDVESYGGKRGFLEHLRTRTLYALGAYPRVDRVEWPAVRRLVFVCKGNICRSPYACAKAGTLGMSAASFGLDTCGGAPADPLARENALLRGIDLSMHRSRRLEPQYLANGDLVILFEAAHRAETRRRIGDRTPFDLLGTWARPIRPHIQDPYGRSASYFQQCFDLIDINLGRLIEHMARMNAPAIRAPKTQNSHSAALPGDASDRTAL